MCNVDDGLINHILNISYILCTMWCKLCISQELSISPVLKITALCAGVYDLFIHCGLWYSYALHITAIYVL